VLQSNIIVEVLIPKDALELLFVRSVWGLDVAQYLPRCYPEPSSAGSERPVRGDLGSAWSALWSQCLRRDTQPDPFWRMHYGNDGLDMNTMRLWTRDRLLDGIDLVRKEYSKYWLADGGCVVRELAYRSIKTLMLLPLLGDYCVIESGSCISSFGLARRPLELVATIGS